MNLSNKKLNQILEALNIDIYTVKKIRQLASNILNIVFLDGHSVNFNIKN